MINEPPPLHEGYSRGPNIKALKARGVINHGSTLVSKQQIPEEFA